MRTTRDHQRQAGQAVLAFCTDLKFAFRALRKEKGLTTAIVLTLALGIGANAAIFTVVRGVLLRPLANRDESRLIYIRQSARGIGAENITFSVPEINDLRERVKSVATFGDFSTIPFTMVGLGDAREVRGGVVGGSYFEVMGLHAVLGRLLDGRDDGPGAAGAAVLTHRFWAGALKGDPAVIGKTIRLGTRPATIVGVLEQSVPYPVETDLFANVVTSPHHLSATMVTGRVHRMTELFGRLAQGATLDSARAELRTVHAVMKKEHPEAYPSNADFRIDAVMFRDQITQRARTVLIVLLAASGLILVIALANVANLILARTVRRESEFAVRVALGASSSAIRRALLAETLLLGIGGAAVGLLSARPMLSVLARYAARFSVRALDLKVDSGLLWTGAALALLAAVFLAFVPRLPSTSGKQALTQSGMSPRVAGGATRRLRLFAIVQVAASFVLLVGAGMLLNTLLKLQSIETGFDARQVLALNVPVNAYGRTPEQITAFYKEVIRRITSVPGVDRVAVGTVVPWRDAGAFGPGFEFSAEGHVHTPGEENPRARFRTVSPGFFAALGVPIISGRDFNDGDRRGGEPVVVVSRSLAQRMFPNQDAINRHIMWTDPVMKFIDVSTGPRRIIGVAADVDDENVVPGPALTVYHPFDQQEIWGGRLFVHTHGDPYALVTPVTRIIRNMSTEQPVEQAATLADIRAEVLAPERLNSIVFGGFAAVALAIAVVGVGGVLAFSTSARTREFGIRLAVGSQPRAILMGVVAEGALTAAAGIAAGAAAGYALFVLASNYLQSAEMPGPITVTACAVTLLIAAATAAAAPASRAARVDVVQALRAE